MGRLMVVGMLATLVVAPAQAQAKGKTDGSEPAPAQIVRLVTHVPLSTLNAVGAGDVLGAHQGFGVFKLGSRLTHDGKPELLTENLAWCPHCAANNWAVAVALSRFGKLTGLRVIDTGTHYCKLSHDSCNLRPFPCYPHTHGLSFFGTSFHSPFLSFGAVIFQDVRGHNFERPTRAENTAVNPFDAFGQTPAVDVGGAYGFLNSGFDPGALAHRTWTQIASKLAEPHNPLARRIDGLANLFTAAICTVTNDHPSRVCTATGVVAAAAARLAGAVPPPPPPPGGPGP